MQAPFITRFIITGTVVEAIEVEERLLNRRLPESFRNWLLENNGLDMGSVHIYPVRDERDTRKTWNSLAYNLQNEWAEAVQKAEWADKGFSHLLPFADFGAGDYFCFDYSANADRGECPVVIWLNQTAEIRHCAKDFSAFKEKALAGEFDSI